MEEAKKLELGKKIKVFLVENNINQKTLAKYLNISDSLLSDKLNGNVKLSPEEFYSALIFFNSEAKINVDANYFMPVTPPTATSDTK